MLRYRFNLMLEDTRESILADVANGRLTPDEAEAFAAERGWAPFASEPAESEFDPMMETTWSLTMAIAWICRRDPAHVRAYWNDFRAKCVDWQLRKWRESADGPLRSAYFLEPRKPANLVILSIAKSLEGTGFLPVPSVNTKLAKKEFIKAARNGHIEVWGRKGHMMLHYLIQPRQWMNLALAVERDEDVAKPAHDLAGPTLYAGLSVSRAQVVTMWPPKGLLAPAVLPQLLRPEGHGAMPLFCAAHWIATKGGAAQFDPLDVTVWRSAYDALLGAATTDGLEISGMRDGTREVLPAQLFGSMQVEYPYGEYIAQEVYSGSEAYLRVYPYQDEAEWFAGKDDSIIRGSAQLWTRLMVAKPEVARRWPFEAQIPTSSIQGTGAPGRPTSMHLVRIEFARRRDAGQVEPVLAKEAEALSSWLRRTHPAAPQAQPKSISNGIREAHRRYWLERPEIEKGG